MTRWVQFGAAGMLGGFVGNGILGMLFSSDVLRTILYDPTVQSALFLEVTPQRNIPLSVAGLVILSATHGWLYSRFAPSIPGRTWRQRGIFWGIVLFAMFWLPQEWFVYHTLPGEPLLLNALELMILSIGSVAEGVVIAALLTDRCASPPSSGSSRMRGRLSERRRRAGEPLQYGSRLRCTSDADCNVR